MAVDMSVRRLAQYRPFAHAGVDAKAAVGDLVTAAIVESGGSVASLGECRDTCQTLWGLDVELDEVRSAVAGLVREGRLQKDGATYELTEAARAEIDVTLSQSSEIEMEALRDWESRLRETWPLLSDDEMSALRSDLDAWLKQVIARHGVEAAMLLYPEEPRAQEMFAALERIGLDFLPERPKDLETIREQALLLFVRQPSDRQRIFLSTLLNTSYVMTVLSLDPEARELVREVSAGQRVYLDTNMIYRLLNLQTPRSFLSTRRLLDLTRELGYDVVVTPWTVQELRTSLERARTFLKSKAVPPGELAALAASATTDENFITAYWRRLREKPVSVDDFFDFYNEIEAHLEALGVTVASEGCLAVDRDEARIQEELAVIEGVPGPRFKPEPVKLHDVKHRLLIERLRGESSRRFANAGFWFLTADSSLPRYDYAARHGDNRLPFCITAGAWLQVVRSLVPRTEDYDQTLIDLMSSPYLRYRGRIGYDTVQEVIGRIDLFVGSSPDLAARLLFNTALLRQVAQTADEQERQQLVDNEIVKAAEAMEQELAEAKRRVEEERGARAAVAARADDLARALETERAATSRLQAELDSERRARQESEIRAQADAEEQRTRQAYSLAQLEERLEARMQEQLEAQRQSVPDFRLLGRRIAGILLSVLSIAIVAVVLALKWVEGPLAVTAVLLSSVLLLHTGTRLLLGIGFLVGLAAGIYEFLD
jgi:predicted nucleic acid-binding protein